MVLRIFEPTARKLENRCENVLWKNERAGKHWRLPASAFPSVGTTLDHGMTHCCFRQDRAARLARSLKRRTLEESIVSMTGATQEKLLPGVPYPLGSTCDEKGTNFALFSEHASAVTLCLFDENGEERQLPLTEVTAHVWHGHVPGIGPGQHYGYRVGGPYAPREGYR